MKKYLIAISVLLFSSYAFAATAFFTGNQKQVQTVTYQWAWQCEYNYNGTKFFRIFKNSCPSSVEVE
jgi:uncharacterized protein YdeI (BOF family)